VFIPLTFAIAVEEVEVVVEDILCRGEDEVVDDRGVGYEWSTPLRSRFMERCLCTKAFAYGHMLDGNLDLAVKVAVIGEY